MTLMRLVQAGLLMTITLGLPQLASSQTLPLDDFSSGSYGVQLSSGRDDARQTGIMVGGERQTVFIVCATNPCGDANPFSQPASVAIQAGSDSRPSALIQSAGYKTYPRLEAYYGLGAPLDLHLLDRHYDRIRVNFDGSDGVINFNIEVFSPSGYSLLGCNLEVSATPVSIDFPFADFQGQASFNQIDSIALIFQAGTAIGGNDWAVSSFEAVLDTEPPSPTVCHG